MKVFADFIANKCHIEKRWYEYHCQYYGAIAIHLFFIALACSLLVFMNVVWYFIPTDNSFDFVFLFLIKLFIHLFTLGVISNKFENIAFVTLDEYVFPCISFLFVKPIFNLNKLRDNLIKKYCTKINEE